MLNYDIFITRLFASAEKTGAPVSGTFELTPRCNLNCKMCYIHKSLKPNTTADFSLSQCVAEPENTEVAKCSGECTPQGEKSTEYWLSLAEEARNAGMLLLLLTGGEPLLRKDFREIYLGCRNLGLLVSVNTNGTLIDEDTVRFFKDNPPQRLNISVYGASPETYTELCGSKDAYQKVINAVKALKEAGVNIKLNYTLTPYNKHDALKVADFAEEVGVPIQAATYSFPPVRACGEVVRLSPKSAAQEHFGWQLHRLGDEKMQKYLDYIYDGVGEFTEPPDGCLDESGERINCRAGSTSFWVTYDGRLTPCGMMTEPSLSLKNGFNASWGELRKRRENIILPVECKNCKLRRSCDMCAAVAFAETGRFGGVPRYACEKAREYRRLSQNFSQVRKK